MNRRPLILLAKRLALWSGVALAATTVLGAVGYALFMVVWLHAPAHQVVLASGAAAVPLLLLAWGAVRLGTSRTDG